MKMIDSHCHLAGEEFDADLTDVIARAQAAGVDRAMIVLAAGDAAERHRAGRVRDLWPGVRFVAGVHPHQAGAHAGAIDQLTADVGAAVDDAGASAIGEIGLDYHYDFAPRDVQQRVFAAQVDLACRRALPIVIHTREATDDTFGILREAGEGVRGVFHCFTGDVAMARAAVDIGFYVSFAGILTFQNADSLREAAAIVPPDRLLAETDAPYLAPRPHRGKRNEPAYVALVYEALAAIHTLPAPELEARLAANFDALFGAA
jgi:TatD DNase family protein